MIDLFLGCIETRENKKRAMDGEKRMKEINCVVSLKFVPTQLVNAMEVT